ncbi:MAG: hypothetical protein IK134_00365 [Oscillospiraceae bacterium]|nr:hypothetical protein [Oscillospiraceae bacterium]
MHVDLLANTKGTPKVIHGTENGKKTACGINLVKPENIGMFTNAGTMTDVIQMTCEKCKTVIAKKLIRESNKEMAAQLKEEQKMLKRERAASKHHHAAPAVPPPPAPSSSSSGYGSSSSSGSSGGGYIPPSMRKAMQTPQKPIDTPPPAPPVPTPMPAPTPMPKPVAQSAEDVLAQFAVPTVPSSLPGMTPPPAPTPVQTPVAQSAEDVLAQFAVPTVPTSLPGMTPPPAPTPVQTPVAQSAEDVLAQFAIPTVPTSLPNTAPPAPTPVQTPAAQSADDVLAQFAIPTVPTSLPNTAPPAQSADDVLAQFAIPTVPTAPAAPVVPDIPAAAPVVDSVDDVLAQFTVPTAPQRPVVSDSAHVSGSSVNQDDILAQFALKQPGAHQYTDEALPDEIPSVPSVSEDPLADLLLMPKGQEAPASLDALPDIANVPSSILTVPTAPPVVPSLNVPQAPPAPPVPAMPVPPMPQEFAVPTVPQGYGQAPAANPNPDFNPFAVPSAPKQTDPAAPMPLFIGYSADGRQVFQKYDAAGNPIPITEPVYSAPPEQKNNNIAVQVAAMASNAALHGNAPILDMDQIMASMGIQDPRKPKKDEGKAINFTEYKIPEKKQSRKKPASARPASAMPDAVPDGPVSAAEAKRRKKVDKINKEFEKQLRSRGIDPKTGGIMIDPRK